MTNDDDCGVRFYDDNDDQEPAYASIDEMLDAMKRERRQKFAQHLRDLRARFAAFERGQELQAEMMRRDLDQSTLQ